ncbi:MAG: LamG domain-containing protein, partial [Limisphaerales bacterium]
RLTCDAVNSCFDIRLKGTGQILASVTGAGSSGLKSITTTGTANGRNPHHFAFVRSGTALNLYIDGALDTSTNVTTIANIKNTANFRIGKTACIGSDGTQYYTGRMDEIQVFNRALSIGEIQGVVTNSGGICIP